MGGRVPACTSGCHDLNCHATFFRAFNSTFCLEGSACPCLNFSRVCFDRSLMRVSRITPVSGNECLSSRDFISCTGLLLRRDSGPYFLFNVAVRGRRPCRGGCRRCRVRMDGPSLSGGSLLPLGDCMGKIGRTSRTLGRLASCVSAHGGSAVLIFFNSRLPALKTSGLTCVRDKFVSGKGVTSSR